MHLPLAVQTWTNTFRLLANKQAKTHKDAVSSTLGLMLKGTDLSKSWSYINLCVWICFFSPCRKETKKFRPVLKGLLLTQRNSPCLQIIVCFHEGNEFSWQSCFQPSLMGMLYRYLGIRWKEFLLYLKLFCHFTLVSGSLEKVLTCELKTLGCPAWGFKDIYK